VGSPLNSGTLSRGSAVALACLLLASRSSGGEVLTPNLQKTHNKAPLSTAISSSRMHSRGVLLARPANSQHVRQDSHPAHSPHAVHQVQNLFILPRSNWNGHSCRLAGPRRRVAEE
jgi:hypothetical protein